MADGFTRGGLSFHKAEKCGSNNWKNRAQERKESRKNGVDLLVAEGAGGEDKW